MKGMYSKLPRYVYLKNEKFIINTDYRIFIEFEEKMQEEGNKKVIVDTLKAFYPAFFKIKNDEMLLEAIDKFLWFYRCGKSEEEYYNQNSKGDKGRNFSYKHDALFIWGAYFQTFGVDLSYKKIHWWRFKAMWLSLPNDTQFNKIKSYRSYKGNDKDILELKNYYKLPMTKQELADKIRRDKLYEMLK